MSATDSEAELRRAAARVMNEWLSDEAAHAARVTWCRAAVDAYGLVGRALYVGGYMQRHDAVSGIALAARIGESLGRGACDLLEASNAYAAMALVRQVVEVEYLLWTFADDSTDAARWNTASRAQLERHYRPATMRKRSGGRFRLAEYQSHCDQGGHPSPRGRILLADSPPADPVRAGWADLGQHLERGYGFLTNACAVVGWAIATEQVAVSVEQARERWHRDDRAASMGPIPIVGHDGVTRYVPPLDSFQDPTEPNGAGPREP